MRPQLKPLARGKRLNSVNTCYADGAICSLPAQSASHSPRSCVHLGDTLTAGPCAYRKCNQSRNILKLGIFGYLGKLMDKFLTEKTYLQFCKTLHSNMHCSLTVIVIWVTCPVRRVSRILGWFIRLVTTSRRSAIYRRIWICVVARRVNRWWCM